ncbi:esterase/lipase/thioesterase [Microseira wollei NIES-4236]|uniref:Esterase/lipase/thioesterase n=2 Tax=Microseira wollei TaxID=467598 RepID=A0AAV3WNB2_9CYAN|nr:esterase/lipase/thioesterase [Microseira wollei NIES-4236]
MKQWIRLAMVMVVGFLVFSLSMPGVALGAEIDLPTNQTETGLPTDYDPLPERKVKLDDATGWVDITYSTLPGYRPLRLDLYGDYSVGDVQDLSLKPPRPLVVFVHGGGWTNGQKRGTSEFTDFPGVLAFLAKSGYVVASLEYRLSGEEPFPGAVKDVKAAIRFLRANAVKFGIDKNKVALWGASAGANLASLASLSCNVKWFDPIDPKGIYKDVSDCVQSFVGWYGPYDLVQLFGDATIFEKQLTEPQNKDDALKNPEAVGTVAFLRCALDGICPHENLTQASPVKYVDNKDVDKNGQIDDPPMLLIHGKADTAVPYQQSQALVEKVKQVHPQDPDKWVKLLKIEGVDHGFRKKTAENKLDTCVTHQALMLALTATFNFFDEHLLQPPDYPRWTFPEDPICEVVYDFPDLSIVQKF